MFKFGFELEGFFINKQGEADIPPQAYPTDGFPGLVELRTTGAKRLEDAYAELVCQNLKHECVSYGMSRFTFSPKQRAELRRRHANKSAWDIQNIYDKNPKLLGNNTIASLQINVSNVSKHSFRDKEGILHPEEYGLFDVPRVVKDLDKEFCKEIQRSKRQPGEYCIKDGVRLEYRSLPNSVFSFETQEARRFLARLKKVFGV